jgi:hypothetical protein
MAANFQQIWGENHFQYARRYQDYKKARDRLNNEDIFHAQEDIDFAKHEYTNFKQSGRGRNPDIDPRFEINLRRLIFAAEASMRIVTERHERQNHLDMVEYLQGPFQSDYDRDNPLLIHQYIHNWADQLNWTAWDTPSGPHYRPPDNH